MFSGLILLLNPKCLGLRALVLIMSWPHQLVKSRLYNTDAEGSVCWLCQESHFKQGERTLKKPCTHSGPRPAGRSAVSRGVARAQTGRAQQQLAFRTIVELKDAFSGVTVAIKRRSQRTEFKLRSGSQRALSANPG